MKKNVTARELALDCLCELGHGAPVQQILNQKLSVSQLAQADRQLASDLLYGSLRRFITINYLLEGFIAKPGRLPEKLHALLRLGVYGLLFQDKVPDYACVSETVNIAKKLYGQKLGNLVNAILRKIQRLGDAPCGLDFYKSKLPAWEAECVYFSIPSAIGSLWLKAYGEENARALLKRSSQRPWAGIRFNPASTEALGICSALQEAEGQKKIGTCAWAFAPSRIPDVFNGKAVPELEKAGVLSFQSPASILVLEKLGLDKWREPLWDCCAGSGIKAAALLERGVPVKLLSDTSKRRLENIRPFFHRLDLQIPPLFRADAQFPPVSMWQGDILADAPCSGLGTLARRPDIRFRFLASTTSLNESARLQAKILNALVALLERGKNLAYITCTINPQENELQIQKILKSYPAMEKIAEWQSPHDAEELDGMYGAVLRKSG